MADEIKLFIGYLKAHWKVLLLALVLMGALYLVYSLYGLPWGPAVYTSIIVFAAAVLFCALSYRVYHKRVKLLLALKQQANRYLGELPESTGLIESCYQESLMLQEARCLQNEAKARKDAQDTKRYYTLWSHQIKTPIAAMRLLLGEPVLDTRALEQELFRVEQYVEMVLHYQRLGANTGDLLLQRYPLDSIVKQALKKVSSLFIYKKLSVRVEPTEMMVLTDEKWLVFVIEQLLTNAVKYTPEGTVSIYPSPDTPDTLVIEDTGIGIRPEDLPLIFEWGYTGYNGRLDKRSTGVGLTLCKQALTMLGHTISVQSVLGKGTVVTLGLSREAFDVE